MSGLSLETFVQKFELRSYNCFGIISI